MMDEKKVWFTLALCFVMTASAMALTISGALTEYTQIKPIIMSGRAAPGDVKIVSWSLDNFDALYSIYRNASVALQNTRLEPIAVNVAIHLFDVDNNLVASGEKTTMPIPSNTTLYTMIPLTWEAGKTVLDYSSHKLTAYGQEG